MQQRSHAPGSNYDVVIIGGGMLGSATAYHLCRAGAVTLLVDRQDAGRATSAGAGILAPEISRTDPEAWFDFAVQAVAYYPALVEELAEAGAGPTSYAQCGMLLVAATEDELSDFHAAEKHIFARRAARDAPALDDLFTVSPQNAKELFPVLADVYGAIYYRGAARVDGRQMAQALQNGALGAGLTRLDGEVTDLVLEGSRVTGVRVGNETIAAGCVVIAGGAWSTQFGDQLGVQIPVEPQRGQIVHWDVAPVETEGWPIVSAFHGHYIVCWPGGRVVTGATRETDSGYAPQTTAAGIREVIDEGLRVAPGLANARLKEIRVGLRPYTADRLPVLGPAPGVDGAIFATGHGPTGLQLGPISGKIAASLALGEAIETEIRAFSVTRFGG